MKGETFWVSMQVEGFDQIQEKMSQTLISLIINLTCKEGCELFKAL